MSRNNNLGAVLALVVLTGAAASARTDKVDSYITAQMKQKNIPGCGVAILRGGKVEKIKSYGLANVELGVKCTRNSAFEIGSVSKQFTAAAVMMLVEEGKVALDDPISKHIPDTPPAWKDVTVRHLLTHTSGIKTYTELTGFDLDNRLTQAQFVSLLAKQPLDFPAGTKYKYNNSGYSLAGFVIENASGKTFWKFLKERIFEPLGMKNTGDRDPLRIIPGRVDGYIFDKNGLRNKDYDVTDLGGAGAICSTINDMAKWAAAVDKNALLQPSSWAEIRTPQKLTDGSSLTYGLGWNVRKVNGHTMHSHGGSTSGFSVHIQRYPDDGLTIVMLTNNEELDIAAEVVKGLVALIEPELAEPET